MCYVGSILSMRKAHEKRHHIFAPLLIIFLLRVSVCFSLVIPHTMAHPLPSHPIESRLLHAVHHWLHPWPVLGVRLPKVDQTEPVLQPRPHVLHPEIEPLAMSVRVQVWPDVKLVVGVRDPHCPHQIATLKPFRKLLRFISPAFTPYLLSNSKLSGAMSFGIGSL